MEEENKIIKKKVTVKNDCLGNRTNKENIGW